MMWPGYKDVQVGTVRTIFQVLPSLNNTYVDKFTRLFTLSLHRDKNHMRYSRCYVSQYYNFTHYNVCYLTCQL